jgi:hypothetical protein
LVLTGDSLASAALDSTPVGLPVRVAVAVRL